MLDWLVDQVSVFKMQHNAHREFNMSVEQHLLHRQRIGDAPIFLDPRDEQACIAHDQIWEMRLILPDGAAVDVAGSSLDNCVSASREMVMKDQRPHMAA